MNSLYDMSKVAEARANFYGLLGQSYIKPPILENVLTELRKVVPEQIQRGFKTLNDFYSKSNRDSPREFRIAISVEFTRLFRALNRERSPPPPYESVYLGKSGCVFEESTIAVLNEYRKFGLSLIEQRKGEPPDHVSFELDFMRFLCTEEAEAWKAADLGKVSTLMKAEKAFLENHLLAWVPKLCENIRVRSQLDLFRGLAELTEDWIRFDHDLIHEYQSATYQPLAETKTN